MLRTALNFSFFFFLLAFFVSCSSSNIYVPKNLSGDISNFIKLDSNIKYSNSYIATLDNSKYIYAGEISKETIKANYNLLCKKDKLKIISNNENTIFLNMKKENILSEQRAISCSIDDGIMAILYADNSFIIQDYNQKILFSNKEEEASLIYSDTSPAIIKKNIVFMPSLNGALFIIDRKNYKSRTFSSDFNKFSNISFLQVLNNNIIIATKNNISLLAPSYQDNIKKKNNFIKIIDGNIYVLATNGFVYIYDKNLKELANKKFKFSNLLGLVSTGKYIYILEKSGYLIKTDLFLEKQEVFNISFDKDKKIFFGEDKIFFENFYFAINT